MMEVLSYSPPLAVLRRRPQRCVATSPNHPLASQQIPTTSSSSSSYLGTSCAKFPVQLTTLLKSPNHRRRARRTFYVVSGIFERFTERSIKAVMLSQREAKACGQDSVSTQHLLLGLVAEDRGSGGFLGSGITIDNAREAVKSLWGEESGDFGGVGTNSEVSASDVAFAPETKRVFEAAVEYSRTAGYNYIAPEHIAIGLFTADNGSADRVLKRLGVNMNHLTAVAVSRLQGELAKEGREPPSTALKRSRENFIPEKVTQTRSPERARDKKALDMFCVDLTERASNGLIDPVIGRDTEVERVVQILCRRTKSNPILLGEAGVGKTAIAEGLAKRVADGIVPHFLMKKRILALDIGLLLAGAKERGELEGRVSNLIKEIKKSGDVILFIDEVHTLIGSGTVGRGIKGSGLDIANLLKPALGRSEIQCVAATTMDEYRSHFEKDKALARRFQPVLIDEPSEEDAVNILLGLRETYESHHRCVYTLEAINAAVHLSAKYIPDRHLPDKAIDLIDEAGSRARMEACKRRKERQTSVLSMSPTDYWQEIRSAQAMHSLASKLSEGDDVSEAEYDRKPNLDPSVGSSFSDDEVSVVGPEDIAAVASLWSGVPVKKLTVDERKLLVGLEEQLRKRVVGQEEAVAAISRAVKRSRVGLKDPDRPIAAMLFCGPTGVGKTELTKALAATYFGSESSMLRLDMSEYMERHTISKLIGSPPGYVGYGEGGTLTEAIRKNPFTLVLLDEIEKAHPDVFNILLQLFEDGHLTDSQGRRVSFKNALIVMTSNIGSEAIAKGRSNLFGLFFAKDDSLSSYAGMKSLLMEELKGYFRPELLNRLDEVVVFRPLEKPQMLEILDIMLREVKERLMSKGIGLQVSEAVMDLICQQGYDRSYGARPLRRAVTQIIEDLVSESILSGNLNHDDAVAFIDLDETGNPVVNYHPSEQQTIQFSDAATTSNL